LFEVFLIVLFFALPHDSWTAARIYRVHSPVLWMLRPLDWCGIGSLLCTALLAFAWAQLFYWSPTVIKRALAHPRIVKRREIVAGAAGVLLAAAVATQLPQTPRSFAASPAVKTTVQGNTAFALDLYQHLKATPGNLFFSPHGISTALALTYAGARGQTESEMARVLHFNRPPDDVHAAFADLAARMDQVQRWRRVKLTTGNLLWCQRNFPFTDSFLKLARTRYRADARLVDFQHAAPEAASEINRWVDKETHGRIEGLLDSSFPLASDTRLVLCNVIYFKGDWAAQFQPRDTGPAPFFVTTNQTVTVPMMRQTARFKAIHAEADDTRLGLLGLPYSGSDLSMIVLLPEDVDGLPALENQLTADTLHRWLAELDATPAHELVVRLPRFTTTQRFDLKGALKSLGMPSLFNVGDADLSGMEAGTNLFISDALHQAFVEVNESGTEAAAATVVVAASRGMTSSFVADHPFIFLIRDNGSGSILFLGRMIDPSK
jgi:serpin B